MTRIRLVTCHPVVDDRLTRELRDVSFVVESRTVSRSDAYTITYGPDVSREDLQRLLRALAPLAPQHEVGRVDGADIELCVGLPAGLEALRVRVRADGDGLQGRASRLLTSLGVAPTSAESTLLRESRLHAPASLIVGFVGDFLTWCAQGAPVEPLRREARVGGDRDEVLIDVVAVERARLDVRQRAPVVVSCDNAWAARELVRTLDAAGIPASIGDPKIAEHAARMRCDAGAGTRDLADELLRAVQKVAPGIDRHKYPVILRRRDHGPTTIVLPLERARTGVLRAYDGDDARRFHIWIQTDDLASVAELRSTLEELELASVHVALLTTPVADWALDWGGLSPTSATGRLVRAAVQSACLSGELNAGASLIEAQRKAVLLELSSPWRANDDDDDRGAVIRIDAPTVAGREAWREVLQGRREREVARARVILCHEEDAPAARIEAAKERFLALGVARVHSSFNILDEREICFSGRSLLAATALRDLVAATSEGPMALVRKSYGDPNTYTVSLRLGPASPRERRAAGDRSKTELDDRPFGEVGRESVRVGDVSLPRRGPWEPSTSAGGEPLCIDDETAATLDHLARAIELGEPCLLEGETGTTKTASITWLAAHLGVPLARLNLHGQTDTAELVGRHLPSPGGGWRWQEGLLLRAMREGSWVLLDELNLAEPDVLERIDALLERSPSFVVSEHDFERFGQGGTPIHEGFRLFATMNPTGYAGRNRLSPAFLDRFRARRFVAPPDEHANESLLRALVLGVQPAIDLRGRRWSEGTLLDPPRRRLASFPGIEELLSHLARLHGSVVAASASAHRSETPSITRRALLSVLDYLDAWHPTPAFCATTVVEAIHRAYLAPLAPGPHREAVEALVLAAGIGAAVVQQSGERRLLDEAVARADAALEAVDELLGLEAAGEVCA